MNIKTAILGIALASQAIFVAPATANGLAATVAAAAKYSTASTDIGTLLDNPKTKAVLDKHMPEFAANPQISMARAMTLRQIQSFAADMLTDDVLDKVDADLAAIK